VLIRTNRVKKMRQIKLTLSRKFYRRGNEEIYPGVWWKNLKL